MLLKAYLNISGHRFFCRYVTMFIYVPSRRWTAEDKNSWEPLASAELSALKGEMYLGKDRESRESSPRDWMGKWDQAERWQVALKKLKWIISRRIP